MPRLQTQDTDPGSTSPLAGSDGGRAWKKWAGIVTVSFLAIRALVDPNILRPAARFIAGSFMATQTEIDLAIRAYGLAEVACFLLLAFAGRPVGRRKLLLFSLGGFTLASVLCGLAATARMLLVFRLLQGLAAGGMLAAAYFIFGKWFSRPRWWLVAAAVGLIGVALGLILGPLVGGYLADEFTWRWIFFASLPLGIVLLILVSFLLPRDSLESPSPAGLNWKEVILATVFLASWNYFALPPEPFARNDVLNVEGASRISSVELAPSFLVETFGKPGEDDHQKVSGTYTFVAKKDGTVFTLYDWNSTNLSEYGADLPSPQEFWSLESPVIFEIGGRNPEASAFAAWLVAKYGSWRTVRAKGL